MMVIVPNREIFEGYFASCPKNHGFSSKSRFEAYIIYVREKLSWYSKSAYSTVSNEIKLKLFF